jgi:hypothetical protein
MFAKHHFQSKSKKKEQLTSESPHRMRRASSLDQLCRVWRLRAMYTVLQAKSPKGNMEKSFNFGHDMFGYISYCKETMHMTALIATVPEAYPTTTLDIGTVHAVPYMKSLVPGVRFLADKATSPEQKFAMKVVTHYSGPFVFDEANSVVHHDPNVSSNPSYVGTRLTQDVRFDSTDALILSGRLGMMNATGVIEWDCLASHPENSPSQPQR